MAAEYDAKANGALCALCPLNSRKPIPAKVVGRRTLAVLGESPGGLEEEMNTYFIGPSGAKLKEGCRGQGIPFEKLHINNAVQCRPIPKMSVKDWKLALDCCRPRLERDLKRSGAKHILALGRRAQLATHAVNKPVYDYSGAALSSKLGGKVTVTTVGKSGRKLKRPRVHQANGPYTVMSTFHPAFALRGNGQYFPVFYEHLLRSWRLATGELKPWRWPPMAVENDDASLDGLRKMLTAKRLGIDIETAGIDPVTCHITCIGIASRYRAVSVNWPPEETFRDPEDGRTARALIEELLASDIPKAAHNGTHDLIGLEREGFSVAGYHFDTILQHAVAGPKLLHRLGFAARVEFHCPAWKTEFRMASDDKGAARFANADPYDLALYNAKDAYMTLRLSHALEPRVREAHNGPALYDGYLTRSLISKHMREEGVVVDIDALKKHFKNFCGRRRRAHADIQKLATTLGFEGDLHPRKASIKRFFFAHLEAPVVKKSPKTGKPSLDEKVLRFYCGHPDPKIEHAARAMLRYRRWNKLVGFVAKLVHVGKKPKKGRWKKRDLSNGLTIHADGRCWGTKGGRWAYRDPNLTTIPKPKWRKSDSKRKQDRDKKILVAAGLRDIITCRPDNTFVEVDYSQLELRIVAILAGDVPLLNWYAEGLDIHTENAKRWFGTEQPQKYQRDFAKTLVYGMNYGGGAETLWKNLIVDYPGVYLSDIERYLEVWYMTHPAIRTWQRKILQKAYDEDFVEVPISGRRQYFHDAVEPTKVYNFPIQGVGADIIDRAIERIYPRIQWRTGERLLLQVHDALIGEGPNAVRLAKLFKSEMERPVAIEGVEYVFPCDVKVGKSWGDAVECKGWKEVRAASVP